ncbi:Glyoxysomal fatty acid beta-oxidation multifunctional protein MFP-a (Partial), partial [Seminavis robusta]|eukprot:Sro538_g162450.1 Glyoxysomal fatty acid beta-oxidation multifunctional protein MFP-a (463) ;mRNA; r:2-1489
MVVFVIDFSQAAKNALNPLSQPVRDYLWQQLETARHSPHVTSVIVTGGTKNFSAGADISEFGGISSAATDTSSVSLIDIVECIENFPKPIVAAIAGNALGGGLEVALACHYRVCTTKARMGLPEVTVGVIPGAGGTQRLPRLIGLQEATQRILTAKPMKGPQALQLGLVDAMVPQEEQLLSTALKWAEWAELMPLDYRRVGRRTVPDAAMVDQIAQFAQQQLPPANRGGFVHRCALKAVLASATQPLDVGRRIEFEQFTAALQSMQGQAYRHAFFAIRKAQKPVAALQQQHPLLSSTGSSKVAVVGAGTMGSGIAMVLLQAGCHVTLVDVVQPALEKGVKNIHKIVHGYVAKKKMTQPAAQQLLSRLASTQKLQDLTHVQLVVEAVVERMKVKKSIFTTLDQVTPPSCILLSNTSTLDIDEMASVLSPQRQTSFAGWHFFSPAHVMKLVEIVRGEKTSTATVA